MLFRHLCRQAGQETVPRPRSRALPAENAGSLHREVQRHPLAQVRCPLFLLSHHRGQQFLLTGGVQRQAELRGLQAGRRLRRARIPARIGLCADPTIGHLRWLLRHRHGVPRPVWRRTPAAARGDVAREHPCQQLELPGRSWLAPNRQGPARRAWSRIRSAHLPTRERIFQRTPILTRQHPTGLHMAWRSHS